MKKLHKSLLIGVGAVVLSTVAIQASDVFRGIEGNLSGLVSDSISPCDAGATYVLLQGGALCIDTYEVAPAGTCPNANPSNEAESQANIAEGKCTTVSAEKRIPWRFVSFTEAQQLCARSGKRLPTNEEWYGVASGITNLSSCAIDSPNNAPVLTGSAQCTAPSGVHDLVGNVWEWLDEEVIEGLYNGRVLPETGYVALVDTDGVIVETADQPNSSFGNDYAWTNSSGVRGMIRGGFYGSGDDAGVFAQNVSVALDFRTAGIGFRCVKDV